MTTSAATRDKSVRIRARCGVVQPRGLLSSGVGRSAMPTFRRASIPATDGVRLVSPTNDPSSALARLTRTGVLPPRFCCIDHDFAFGVLSSATASVLSGREV